MSISSLLRPIHISAQLLVLFLGQEPDLDVKFCDMVHELLFRIFLDF